MRLEELIVIEDGKQTVLGRDLYKYLGIKERYTQWFDRYLEYGFEENIDFITLSEKTESTDNAVFGGKRVIVTKNHQLTIDMAKELAMLQKTQIGKETRKYFLEVERLFLENLQQQIKDLQIDKSQISSNVKNLPDSDIKDFIYDKLEDSTNKNNRISSIILYQHYIMYCVANKLSTDDFISFTRKIKNCLPSEKYTKNIKNDNGTYSRGYKNLKFKGD